jgi:hypothetical protein
MMINTTAIAFPLAALALIACLGAALPAFAQTPEKTGFAATPT